MSSFIRHLMPAALALVLSTTQLAVPVADACGSYMTPSQEITEALGAEMIRHEVKNWRFAELSIDDLAGTASAIVQWPGTGFERGRDMQWDIELRRDANTGAWQVAGMNYPHPVRRHRR